MKNKKTKFIISAIFLAFAFIFLIGNNASAESVRTFSDGDSEKNIAFSNRQGNGEEQCEIFHIALPSKNSVSTANMDISGDVWQSKLDLVFIVDTSSHMVSEWNDVCLHKNNIINDLKTKHGIDIQATFYGLEFSYPGGYGVNFCSEDDLALFGRTYSGSYKNEDWMRGIHFISTPGNHSWRDNTTKTIIAISNVLRDDHKGALGRDDSNEEIESGIERTSNKAKENNVIVYGLFDDDALEWNSSDPYKAMEYISRKTGGLAVKFADVGLNDYKPLIPGIVSTTNKALSGLSLKVGRMKVWEYPEKLTNKQKIGGAENSPFVKALNDYSTQKCNGQYPCNVPIEICSSKPVNGDLKFNNLYILMTPPSPPPPPPPKSLSTISGPCQNLVPCKDDCKLSDIFVMIQNIVNCLVFISTIICLLFLVIGGLLYIFSLGNPENLTKAKNTILWALGGLALVFLAWLIVNTMMQFMGVGGGFLMWSSVG